MSATPIVQLYSKRLTVANLDAFLAARPEHVGWQVNLQKLSGADLERACSEGAAIAARLRAEGVRSVFLVHPSIDAEACAHVLRSVSPDVFLASARRSREVIEALRSAKVVGQIMVPVGILAPGGAIPGYDPVGEVRRWGDVADWLTTDTITPRDAVERFGCSGEANDREVLARCVAASAVPVIAAGGFDAANVAATWRDCRPSGFDACTAVCTNGVPNRDKATAFAAAIRNLRPT